MKRVLIVDDDPDIREALVELFEDSYHVLVGTNGLEALEILAREHADAVVLDLMMPIMDGETFLKKLHERGQSIPVVVLSASRDLERRARSLGATGYCSKPCSAEQVLAEVARVMGGASGGSEQSGGDAPPKAPTAPPTSGTKASRVGEEARRERPARRRTPPARDATVSFA